MAKQTGTPLLALNEERRRLLNKLAIFALISAIVVQTIFILFIAPNLSGTLSVDLSSVRAPVQGMSFFTTESFIIGSWVSMALIAASAVLFFIGAYTKKTLVWATGIAGLMAITSYYAGHTLGVSLTNLYDLGENLYRLLIGLAFYIAFTAPYLLKVIREQKTPVKK